MLYKKNIRPWEQVLRSGGGLAIGAAGALATIPGSLLCYGLLASGLVTAMTGLVGWCPACATIGRKSK